MNANKVTLEGIHAKIKDECYLVLPDGRTTVCILTMENGYTVQGLSACVDAANFDINLGRKYAHQDAINKIWPLEGYLLAQRMHDSKSVSVTDSSWTVTQKANAIVAALKNDPAPWGYKKDGTPKKKPGGGRK